MCLINYTHEIRFTYLQFEDLEHKLLQFHFSTYSLRSDIEMKNKSSCNFSFQLQLSIPFLFVDKLAQLLLSADFMHFSKQSILFNQVEMTNIFDLLKTVMHHLSEIKKDCLKHIY